MTKWIGVADKKDLRPGTSICAEAAGHQIACLTSREPFMRLQTPALTEGDRYRRGRLVPPP